MANHPEDRTIPVEDIRHRTPDPQPIQLGYGQEPPLRRYFHDFVTDEVTVEGPIIEVKPPERPF